MRPLGQDLAWRLVANLGSVVLTAAMWAQSCPTLCDPMACSLPDSSVHGILQTRVLSGLPFPPPGHLPHPGIEHVSPALPGRPFIAEPPAH